MPPFVCAAAAVAAPTAAAVAAVAAGPLKELSGWEGSEQTRGGRRSLRAAHDTRGARHMLRNAQYQPERVYVARCDRRGRTMLGRDNARHLETTRRWRQARQQHVHHTGRKFNILFYFKFGGTKRDGKRDGLTFHKRNHLLLLQHHALHSLRRVPRERALRHVHARRVQAVLRRERNCALSAAPEPLNRRHNRRRRAHACVGAVHRLPNHNLL